MSETKTYVFPESGGNGGGSGMMAMLAPLLQQKGIDPNLLVAMNGKNNNSGFGGEGSWFIWVIFLFFLMGWGNNGNECGHMATHICQAFGIDPYGEEIQYIGDDIIEKTWEYAKTLLCECDCCKNKVKHLIR